MHDAIDQHLRECQQTGQEPDWRNLLLDADPLYDGSPAWRDRAVRAGIVLSFIFCFGLDLYDRSIGGYAFAAFAFLCAALALARCIGAGRFQARDRKGKHHD